MVPRTTRTAIVIQSFTPEAKPRTTRSPMRKSVSGDVSLRIPEAKNEAANFVRRLDCFVLFYSLLKSAKPLSNSSPFSLPERAGDSIKQELLALHDRLDCQFRLQVIESAVDAFDGYIMGAYPA